MTGSDNGPELEPEPEPAALQTPLTGPGTDTTGHWHTHNTIHKILVRCQLQYAATSLHIAPIFGSRVEHAAPFAFNHLTGGFNRPTYNVFPSDALCAQTVLGIWRRLKFLTHTCSSGIVHSDEFSHSRLDVIPEQRSDNRGSFYFIFISPPSPPPFQPQIHSSSLQEYEKCYELVHNTVPHAKNIPSNPSSGESLRSLCPVLGAS